MSHMASRCSFFKVIWPLEGSVAVIKVMTILYVGGEKHVES